MQMQGTSHEGRSIKVYISGILLNLTDERQSWLCTSPNHDLQYHISLLIHATSKKIEGMSSFGETKAMGDKFIEVL